MPVTLADLRAKTRVFLDDQRGRNWPDNVVNSYVNDAQRALWVTLANKDTSFGLREAITPTRDGEASYFLPKDILGRRVRKLLVCDPGSCHWREIARGTLEDVVRAGVNSADIPFKYCELYKTFRVGPPPTAKTGVLRLFYTRQPTLLEQDKDHMDSDSEFAEIISCDAAIRAMRAKGGDITNLSNHKTELLMEASSAVASDDLLTSNMTWIY